LHNHQQNIFWSSIRFTISNLLHFD